MSELKEYRVAVPTDELKFDGVIFVVKADCIECAIESVSQGKYDHVEDVFTIRTTKG